MNIADVKQITIGDTKIVLMHLLWMHGNALELAKEEVQRCAAMVEATTERMRRLQHAIDALDGKE